MTESNVIIGAALPSEVAALSELAQRAKAHWGYPAERLAAWRPQLTVSVPDLVELAVFVARQSERPVGFYALGRDGDALCLEHFWVDPPSMGRGIGRLLLRHAQQEARTRGCDVIQIDADPNAEAFYVRLGAVRVGVVAAPVAGTARELPRLRLDVSRGDSDAM